MEFFSKTFWASQFKDMGKIEMMIDRMLQLLEEWEFIKGTGGGDFQVASEIGEERYKATLIGKRVAELRAIEEDELPLTRGAAANSGYEMSDDFDAPLEDFADYMK